MSASESPNDTDVAEGKITEAALDHMRAWLNKPRQIPHWNSEVTKDNIWHFALGVGDDNPLWWDDEYAKASPRGGITAPPTYLYSHSNGPRLKPENFGAPTEFFLPGTLGLWAGEKWKWHRPVHIGEKISANLQLVEATVHEGGSFGGRSVTQVERMQFVTDQGEIVAEVWHNLKRFERNQARSKNAYLERALAAYSSADRERFERHYRDEASALRRGAQPRFVEDTQIGDQMGPMLKGPLTVNNMIGFMLGWGSGLNAANRMLYSLLAVQPGARMVHPESGVVDNIESPHWDRGLARLSGLPDGYDFGCQRFSWFAHFMTDWIGDHGELTDLDFKMLKPNIINDVTWLTGEVTAVDLHSATATVKITATNQLDQVTAVGSAVARLPRRTG
jgi:acyl dehydratase